MKSSLRSLLAVLCTPVLAWSAEVASVSPQDAAKLVAEGKAVLVDVREAPEWKASGVAAPATLLPKSDLDGDQKQWKPFLEQNKGKQILLYCASGGRSKTVAAALAEKGLRTANVGGFRDWARAGLPVRQVE
ncbi:MAG: rhodanese-like domain-containing protein [Opitutaceae bacterium]